MRPDRRKFIRQTLHAALGGASLYSALGGLQVLQAAAISPNYVFTDYKALVCVFLYGGNDGFNTIVPYTQAAFNSFYGPGGVRPQLALNRAQLHPLTDASGSSADGIQYAMHAQMPQLAALFNQASSPLAIMATRQWSGVARRSISSLCRQTVARCSMRGRMNFISASDSTMTPSQPSR